MKILFAILLALAVHSISAEPYVGIRVQGTFSTLKPVGGNADAMQAFNANKKLYLGPQVGISIFTRIGKYFAFAPEVNFMMKGLKYDEAGSSRLRRYIQAEVPMLFKAGYGTEHFFIYATGGGYASVDVTIQDIVKPSDGGKEKTRVYFSEVPDQRFDAGIATGGGGMWIGKKGVLDVAFRYNIGMMKHYKNVEAGQPNTKWRSFGVSLAYMWKGK